MEVKVLKQENAKVTRFDAKPKRHKLGQHAAMMAASRILLCFGRQNLCTSGCRTETGQNSNGDKEFSRASATT